jgi:hypothetical protein
VFIKKRKETADSIDVDKSIHIFTENIDHELIDFIWKHNSSIPLK